MNKKSNRKQVCGQVLVFLLFWCYRVKPSGAKELQKLAQELQSGAQEGPKIDKKSKKIERWIPGGCPEHPRGRKNKIFHDLGEDFKLILVFGGHGFLTRLAKKWRAFRLVF